MPFNFVLDTAAASPVPGWSDTVKKFLNQCGSMPSAIQKYLSSIGFDQSYRNSCKVYYNPKDTKFGGLYVPHGLLLPFYNIREEVIDVAVRRPKNCAYLYESLKGGIVSTVTNSIARRGNEEDILVVDDPLVFLRLNHYIGYIPIVCLWDRTHWLKKYNMFMNKNVYTLVHPQNKEIKDIFLGANKVEAFEWQTEDISTVVAWLSKDFVIDYILEPFRRKYDEELINALGDLGFEAAYKSNHKISFSLSQAG